MGRTWGRTGQTRAHVCLSLLPASVMQGPRRRSWGSSPGSCPHAQSETPGEGDALGAGGAVSPATIRAPGSWVSDQDSECERPLRLHRGSQWRNSSSFLASKSCTQISLADKLNPASLEKGAFGKQSFSLTQLAQCRATIKQNGFWSAGPQTPMSGLPRMHHPGPGVTVKDVCPYTSDIFPFRENPLLPSSKRETKNESYQANENTPN